MNSKLLPWVVCMTAAIFPFYSFFQMNMFNIIGPAIMRTYQLSPSQMGVLAACYFYSDSLLLIPAGLLLDRYSTRLLVLVALCSSLIGTLFLVTSSNLYLMMLGRLLGGVGHAFAILNSFRLVSRWFPAKQAAFVMSLITFIALLGGVTAQTPLELLIEWVGWRSALYVDITIGVIAAIIIGYLLIDNPKNERLFDEPKKLPFIELLKLAMRNPQNWYCGIFACALSLPLLMLGAVWGNTYLIKADHLSALNASFVTAMIFLGMMIGSPIAGWISDYIGLRKPIMVVGALISLIDILIIIYANGLSLTILSILFFLLGLFASAQIISYPTIAESNNKTVTGTALAFSSVIIIAGGAMAQTLFGFLLETHWSFLRAGDTSDANNFFIPMAILPLAFIASLFAAYKIKETYCTAKN